MKTRKRTRKWISLVLTMVICFGIVGMNGQEAHAATTITGNHSKNTAYNYGSWSSINSTYSTILLESGQEESWLQFQLNAGEHIYIRSSYDDPYAGEWFEIRDGSGNTVGVPQFKPGDVYNPDTVVPDVYLDCDNNSTSTKTYYLVLHRNTVPSDVNIYFSLTAYNRLRTKTTTFAVSGSASNPGNAPFNVNGVNSSIITLNLNNNNKIPPSAIVTSIKTKGTQSPKQGNVHHMIMPGNTGSWYTSTVSSADSGSFAIKLEDNVLGKQQWSFRYNALASAKSTMSSVQITMNFQYDLHDTNYELIL